MRSLGRFSRERLERLDERRHSIVHGRTPPAKMPIVWETERWHKPEEDIRWLAFVGLHLVLMVASHHDCKPSLLDLAEFQLADRRGEYRNFRAARPCVS